MSLFLSNLRRTYAIYMCLLSCFSYWRSRQDLRHAFSFFSCRRVLALQGIDIRAIPGIEKGMFH